MKLHEMILAFVIIAVGVYVFIWINIHPNHGRNRVAQAKANIRMLQSSLEQYFIDNQRYPDSLVELTTPIAYIGSIPYDPFAEPQNTIHYRYFKDPVENSNQWYILLSNGPDWDVDIPSKIFNATNTLSPQGLYPFMYYPSNGTDGGGDIYRIGP